MLASELAAALERSVAEVLETMFFTGIDEGEPAAETEAPLSAALDFHGTALGKFGLSLALSGTRALASAFLGTDEESVTEAQAAEVLCEFANVLCGSLLSRVDPRGVFELSAPALQPIAGIEWKVSRGFAVAGAKLEVGIVLTEMNSAASPPFRTG